MIAEQQRNDRSDRAPGGHMWSLRPQLNDRWNVFSKKSNFIQEGRRSILKTDFNSTNPSEEGHYVWDIISKALGADWCLSATIQLL